jgi:catechol 2,3-dioxygenase-like lactoylglutathione lyase family enzyme
MATVRYFVDDVDAAIGFYVHLLGFEVVMRPAPPFAMLRRDDLRLLLSAPGGGPGGGAAMPDGRLPEPGGWNRFQLEVDDLDAEVERLAGHGVQFQGPLDPAPVDAPIELRGRRHLWTRPETSGGFMIQLIEAQPS